MHVQAINVPPCRTIKKSTKGCKKRWLTRNKLAFFGLLFQDALLVVAEETNPNEGPELLR